MRIGLLLAACAAALAACEAATNTESDGGTDAQAADASADSAPSDGGSPVPDTGLPDRWANPLTTECDAWSTECGDYFSVGGQSIVTFCFRDRCAFECSGYPGNSLCEYLDASCQIQPPSVFGICIAPPATDP